MTFAFGGASIDGSAYTDVVDLAGHSPGWGDTAVAAWSAYGRAVFAVLMVLGGWGAVTAVTALAAPVAVVLAYGVDAVLKLVVREDRPCRNLRVRTLEACPAPGDWSFPSNHAAIAAATAVALVFVSRRLGAVAAVAALAMAASRAWVGVHYPHDVAVGVLVGVLVAFAAMILLRRWAQTLARHLSATVLRPLLAAP
ncbi:phosphatase PAP2 family protein [Streptomyces rubiginosohelvolus]